MPPVKYQKKFEIAMLDSYTLHRSPCNDTGASVFRSFVNIEFTPQRFDNSALSINGMIPMDKYPELQYYPHTYIATKGSYNALSVHTNLTAEKVRKGKNDLFEKRLRELCSFEIPLHETEEQEEKRKKQDVVHLKGFACNLQRGDTACEDSFAAVLALPEIQSCTGLAWDGDDHASDSFTDLIATLAKRRPSPDSNFIRSASTFNSRQHSRP